jgi:hypothetical protein
MYFIKRKVNFIMASISSHSTSLPNPRHVAAELVGLSTPGILLRTIDAKRFFGNDVTQLPSVRPNQDTGFTYFGNVLTTRKGHTLIGAERPVDTFLQRVDKFTPRDSTLRTIEGGPLKNNALTGFFTGNSAVFTVEPINPSTVSVLYKANALIGRALQSLYGAGPQHEKYSSLLAFNRYCQKQFPNLAGLLSDPRIPLNSRNPILEEAMRTLAEPFPDIAEGWLAPVVNMIKSQ